MVTQRAGGGPRQSYWLLIQSTDVSVYLKNPGFDIDVIVSAGIMEFYQVWLGRVPLPEAFRKQQVRLDGTPADVRAFPGRFAWSPMVDAVRAALADRRVAPNRRNQVKQASTGEH